MKISELSKTAAGGTPLKSNRDFYEGGKVPWLLSGEVCNRDITKTRNFITEAGLEGSSAKIFPKDTVVIAMYGATAGEVGILRCEASTNQAVCGIYPNDRFLPEYLYYFFLNNKEKLVAQAVGNAQPNISQAKIKNTDIDLPIVPEQNRIVAILDQAFADIARARALTEKNLKNAQELFDSTLQQVFSQRGQGWVDRPLGEFCRFSSGGTPSKKNDAYWEGEIPWVSGRDMKSTQLSDSLLHISQQAVDETSTRMAEAGALLILVRGMGLAHGAQVAELLVPCAFNQDIRGIHAESEMNSRYLVFALKYQINRSDNVMSSAAHGTLKINMDELKEIVIPVPAIAVQNKIVGKIGDLIEVKTQLESVYRRKINNLEELKKSLLQKAFSGQLTTKDAA